MTRKDFILIADTIQQCTFLNQYEKVLIAEKFAQTIKATNPRFDGGRFVEHATKEAK